jgi:IS5 family transposase
VTALPWNIRQALDHLTSHSWRYLLDVAHFIQTHTIKPDKLLAFHCFEGACIRKGKVGKENEFGRVFQLGRIGGNFRIPFTCTDVRMNDKQSLLPAMAEHAAIFGADVLEAVGTDKGYYSATNIREVQQAGINADGIQRPCKVKDPPPEEVVERLRNRRAGIEPLIGHAKAFGLGRSKMKSDRTTLASGYRAVMGFNLHQLMRYLAGKEEPGRTPAQQRPTPTKTEWASTLKLRSQSIFYFATATS